MLEQLEEIWQGVYQRDWITIQETQSLESLLKTEGPLWLVTKLISY